MKFKKDEKMEKISQEINNNKRLKEILEKLYFRAIFEKNAKSAFYRDFCEICKGEKPTRKTSDEIFEAIETIFLKDNKKLTQKRF